MRAREYLTRSTQLAAGEPAGWADLSILEVRQQQFDAAFESADKARTLAPANSRIEALIGLIQNRRGNTAGAEEALKKAIDLDAHNLKAIYSLAEQTERSGDSESLAATQQLLKKLLALEPSNAAVLLDDLRLAAKRGDTAEAQRALEALQPLSAPWPDAAKQQFERVRQALGGSNIRVAAIQVQFLRNILLRVPSYRENLDQIMTPATLVAEPFTHFLRLPSLTSEPAPPDTGIHFQAQNLSATSQISWLGSIWLNEQESSVAWIAGAALHLRNGAVLPLPGPTAGQLPSATVAAADLNYDFKNDIAIATGSGLRIYRQDDPQHFRDITAEAKIPSQIANGSYTGVWAFDVDLDGDLDLIVGVPHGDPVVLRNNGDGTFTVINPFKGVDGLTAFAAGDLDGDGDPDVALIDGNGTLRVLDNERLGAYRPHDVPGEFSAGVQCVAAADINGDGVLDLVLLRNNSSVLRLSEKQDSPGWNSAVVIPANSTNARTLLVGDLDNNGALDIVVDDRVYLNDGTKFGLLSSKLTAPARAVSDLNADGRLDLLALNEAGAASQLMNAGAKNYRWQVIRTKAAHATGDQRMNSFGIGGQISIRADLLTEDQVIDSPVLHFGLGEHSSVEFARIVWPNGYTQAEFDLNADQAILAEQRIKGSCPMLFTWNGQRMQFVKDVGPWGSALGLNVNAQGKGIYGTREWFNIRGDQLQPDNGFYDLRITAEYWETYYMDHYSLVAVDHPSNAEVFTDERFALPSPAPNLIATTRTRPFIRATDDNGSDVTGIVRDLDNHFLDTFGRGQYQGLTRDHWVELELPPDAPHAGSLYLVGQGWIHDTDATIVKAQAQNSHAHPQGLSIEVPDSEGHWRTVRDGLGFPKGRVKTVILDITGIFVPNAPRRLRLRTNLELYWDKLAWAGAMPSSERLQIRHLDLAAADLRFRGFSLITQANPSSPELPHYDRIKESDLRWRDQEGYATRYGGVRELLQKVDDRYVITSPGDELRMTFAALPAPSEGWTRDFILICDGWVKDGDYNSTFASTILPLPYHAMTDYVVAPTTLEADHAYQLHPDDWRTYQTRYVTPRYFNRSLWELE